ncbi:hypothetical protein [Chitiniphilus shinanonensis]|uniref:hypothetical protein n=1 Tax=Chitiniphilus shinanonensis TaxID=553088 RepID=UPI0030293B70
MNAKQQQLARITALLEQHTQRATYGAVGGIVGLPAQSVMSGQMKMPRNSWVVSTTTKRPTGYSPQECHPLLARNAEVIRDTETLRAWLDRHGW